MRTRVDDGTMNERERGSEKIDVGSDVEYR